MVVEMLKQQYRPCEPIVLSDMKWLQQSPGALRQMFKRMSDKGIVKRYMNGVYYFPEKGKMPTIDDVVYGMYIGNRKKIFGYYSGYETAGRLGVTDRTDDIPIIVTNKETSRGRYRTIANRKVYLKKTYVTITKENVAVVEVLDFIREWDVYSDLSEADTFEKVKDYIKKQGITKKDLLAAAVYFPGKVSLLLVKYKMV